MQPYSSTDMTTAWKKSHFILSEISDSCMIDIFSKAVHAFALHFLTSFSADEILLPMYVNLSTYFLFNMEMSPSGLKHMNSISSEFT